MDKHILFCCDAGINAGLGHISRCLVLAKELIRHDYKPLFLIKTDSISTIKSFLEFKGIDNYEFISTKVGLQDELQQIDNIIQRHTYKFAVLDHYRVTQEYVSVIKNLGLKILQFDYACKSHLHSDIILNSNPGAHYLNYNDCTTANQKVLTGLTYALISDEIKMMRGSHSENKKVHIVFALGGGNKANYVLRSAASCIKSEEEFKYFLPEAAFTPGNRDNNHISWISGQDEYLRSIQKADIVICNAGVTATEMLFLGKKMIVLNIADNQELNWRFFSESIGFAYRPDDFLNKLNKGNDIFHNRLKTQQPAIEIPDGEGANRIFKEIETLINS